MKSQIHYQIYYLLQKRSESFADKVVEFLFFLVLLSTLVTLKVNK